MSLDWLPPAISQKGLKGLAKYKYSAVDLSPISYYILRHYWTWAAELFPIWMAPNLITLLGFFFVLGNLLVLLIWTPDLEVVGPSWIYFSFAFGLWMYSTFDNVDGKQARKTGTSSPLGELFDHGLDALNCTTGGLLQCAGVVTGFTNWSFIIIGLATVAFFFSTWETYFTGTMYLGTINGPTEGLLISIATLIISGVYGPLVWKLKLFPAVLSPSLLPQVPDAVRPLLTDVTIGQTAIYAMIVMLFTIQIPPCLYRAFQACLKKKMGFGTAVYAALQFLVMVGFAAAWILAPGSTLTSHHVIVFSLAWGIALGKINALIILHHVTHQDYPSYNTLIVPFGVGAVASWARVVLENPTFFNKHWEGIYVWAVFSFFLVDYSLWAATVIDQICKHLKIKCFVIPYPARPTPLKREEEVVADSTPVKGGRTRKSVGTPVNKVKDADLTPRRITRSSSKKKTA